MVSKILNGIKIFFFNLFTKKNDEPKPKIKKIRDKTNTGSLYYLGDLLDYIDNYFALMKIVKRYFRDAYNLYRKIGGQVVNGGTMYEFGSLDKFWLDTRPSFGSLFFNGDGSHWFLYYQKLKCPHHVQKKTKSVYQFGVVGAMGAMVNKNIGYSFHVSVSKNGDITLLKEVQYKVIQFKSGQYRKKIFAYPAELLRVFDASDNDESISIEEYAARNFKFVANKTKNVQAGIRILATKNKTTCAFNIDMLRTPYFFKDRQKTINQNGKTKKIFHIVRTHKRKDKFIKTHFRGLSKFNWKGFDVEIKNPKSNKKLADFNVSADTLTDDEIEESGAKYLTSSQFADLLKKECA